MADVYQNLYNPDVLSCLANLSNDEVFTPPEVANRMLDLLPQELFRSPDTTFLDPACKSGVFLREIAKRLLVGLENEIPDLQQRVDHIFHKQLYGIAITELTSLLSRRSVYCSKYPNSKYSVTRFEDADGNVRYKNVGHRWKDGKCVFCGVTRKSDFGSSERGAELESHAYEFIHTIKPEEIFKMKFDVIIGNPPYQLNVGVEKDNYAIPIYQKFVEQAKRLNPRYLSMIIPARWYAGGRGLDDFRKEMLEDNRVRVLHDFPESIDCFPGVEIQGGVCYFLWKRDERGDCAVSTHMNNAVNGPLSRPLLEKGCSTFIRYNQSVSILRKVTKDDYTPFSTLVSAQTPFGLITSYKGTPEKVNPTDIKMYISGNEKQYKGGSAFVPLDKITKGREMIPWHKVYVCEAYGGGMAFPHSIISKPFYGEPNTVCNQSYLVIGPFDDETVCRNVMSYLSTKFCRFMILQKKNAQHAMRGVYEFVPIQDFSKPWTDAELYAKYNLTEEEIAFIESMIKPMES